jgi:hypothetical protein
MSNSNIIMRRSTFMKCLRGNLKGVTVTYDSDKIDLYFFSLIFFSDFSGITVMQNDIYEMIKIRAIPVLI